MTGIVAVGGVDKLLGRKRCTALLTLVAVGSLGTAARASADDVAVGEELACHLVAELLLSLLLKHTLVVESAEEVGGKLMVNLRCGAAVDVE